MVPCLVGPYWDNLVDALFDGSTFLDAVEIHIKIKNGKRNRKDITVSLGFR